MCMVQQCNSSFTARKHWNIQKKKKINVHEHWSHDKHRLNQKFRWTIQTNRFSYFVINLPCVWDLRVISNRFRNRQNLNNCTTNRTEDVKYEGKKKEKPLSSKVRIKRRFALKLSQAYLERWVMKWLTIIPIRINKTLRRKLVFFYWKEISSFLYDNVCTWLTQSIVDRRGWNECGW